MSNRVLTINETEVVKMLFAVDDYKEELFSTLIDFIQCGKDIESQLRRLVFSHVSGLECMSDEVVTLIQTKLLLLLECNITSEYGITFSDKDFQSFVEYIDHLLESQHTISSINKFLDGYFAKKDTEPYQDLQYILKHILGYNNETYDMLLSLIPQSLIRNSTSLDNETYDSENIIALLESCSFIEALSALAIHTRDKNIVLRDSPWWVLDSIGEIAGKCGFVFTSGGQENIFLEFDGFSGKYRHSELFYKNVLVFFRLFILKWQQKEASTSNNDGDDHEYA